MALLLVGYAGTQDYFEAAAFVVRAAGMTGVARSAAALEADAVSEAAVTISWRDGELRGRTYTPSSLSGRPILLVPGVHAAGIDEPRLINFAREIAATGHPVLTAELTDLTRYQITPRTTDMIEDCRRLGHPVPGARDAGARPGRGNHGNQLRRWPVGRRRVADGRTGGLGAVVRRPRRPAAHAALPLHRHSRRTAGCGRRTTTAW